MDNQQRRDALKFPITRKKIAEILLMSTQTLQKRLWTEFNIPKRRALTPKEVDKIREYFL